MEDTHKDMSCQQYIVYGEARGWKQRFVWIFMDFYGFLWILKFVSVCVYVDFKVVSYAFSDMQKVSCGS